MTRSRSYRFWTSEEKKTVLQHLEDHKGKSGKWFQNQEVAFDEMTKLLETVTEDGKRCLERQQVVYWVKRLPQRLEAGCPKVSLQDIYTKGPRACGVRGFQAFSGVVSTRTQKRDDRNLRVQHRKKYYEVPTSPSDLERDLICSQADEEHLNSTGNTIRLLQGPIVPLRARSPVEAPAFKVSEAEKQFILIMRGVFEGVAYGARPLRSAVEERLQNIFLQISNHVPLFASLGVRRVVRHDGLTEDAVELCRVIFPTNNASQHMTFLSHLHDGLAVHPSDVFRSFVSAAVTEWAFGRFFNGGWNFSRILHEDMDHLLRQDAPEFRKLLYRKFYLKYLNREVVRHIPSKAKELADRLVAVLVSMSVVVPDWKPAQPEGTPNWQLCLDQFLTFSRGMNLVFEQALELYRQFEQGGFRCITGFPQFGERFDSSWMTPVAEQWKDVTVTSQVCLCVLPAIYSRELEASHPIPGAGEKVLESRAVVTLL